MVATRLMASDERDRSRALAIRQARDRIGGALPSPVSARLLSVPADTYSLVYQLNIAALKSFIAGQPAELAVLVQDAGLFALEAADNAVTAHTGAIARGQAARKLVSGPTFRL